METQKPTTLYGYRAILLIHKWVFLVLIYFAVKQRTCKHFRNEAPKKKMLKKYVLNYFQYTRERSK